MAGKLLLFLIYCLMKDAICKTFEISLPSTVEVLRGSCVTVPCSFDFETNYQAYFNDQCEKSWVYSENNKPRLKNTSTIIGKLIDKNCTTIFTYMQPEHSNTYYFRVDCNNTLKYTYKTKGVKIQVKDITLSPILTPSTLEAKEGDSVSLTCSAPAPSLTPSALTWTPLLSGIKEALQNNQEKTTVKTSVLTFTASRLHHGQNISCTAVYQEKDGSCYSSHTTSLMPDVLFPPGILPSSNCNKSAGQIYCSCEAVGNPCKMQWLLDGEPVNQFSEVSMITEPFNSTFLRSIVILHESKHRHLSSLLCISFNSLGSASKLFHTDSFNVLGNKDKQLMFVFIASTVILLALLCALVFVTRFRKTRHYPEIHTIEGEKVPDTIDDDIYVNTSEMM